MNRYLLLALCLLFADCTNAPRYGNSVGTRKKSNPKNLKTAKRIPKVITGVSSFYGSDFHGKLTANGEVFDMYGLTAAHKTLPLNTIVRVTNLANNKSLILRINDRGPYIKGRILDCSYGAAKKLDFLLQGTTKVRIEIIEVGDGKYMKHKS
tara:strand:- start:1221 stop:1676 length:456 start_codon:yes stop_codon:yes gene_type:complete